MKKPSKPKKRSPEVVKMADLIAKYAPTKEEQEKLFHGLEVALGLKKGQ